MNVKSKLLKVTAQLICKKEQVADGKALEHQKRIFLKLMRKGNLTKFGADHHFSKIKSVADFQSRVPLNEYENHKNYYERIKSGELDVMWPGRPKYLAKTSGTTSGTKFIPVSNSSISNHISSARNALFSYVNSNKDTEIFDGKMLFLSGSPDLIRENGVSVGRLSGIVNHEIPAWFQRNKLPTVDVNRLEPWEHKIDKIIDEILPTDIRAISGIPPWIQMLLEKILERTKAKTIAEVFPNLELYIHGGVNFKPYEDKLRNYIGRPVCFLETYPASEGFIGYQDDPAKDEMRLIINSGIFYEFVSPSDVFAASPKRLTLSEVELDTDYAIVLTTNAGLWSYVIGDIIQFKSLAPYKIKVSGRVGQYISAFGEHVISSEIDYAITETIKKHDLNLVEFTVAPQINPNENTLPYYEWFIEFENPPKDIQAVSESLNYFLAMKNSYYKDLFDGKMLRSPIIRQLRKGSFKEYLISINKYGEQFKVPRLSNERKVVEALINYILS